MPRLRRCIVLRCSFEPGFIDRLVGCRLLVHLRRRHPRNGRGLSSTVLWERCVGTFGVICRVLRIWVVLYRLVLCSATSHLVQAPLNRNLKRPAVGHVKKGAFPVLRITDMVTGTGFDAASSMSP